ncbi:condensation domain-containing protein [Micromonospora sp. NPDC003197]
MRDQMTVPMSSAQRLLWWVEEVTPGMVFGPRFVALGAYRISGPIEAAALRDALDSLVARHAALRTNLVGDDRMARHQTFSPGPVPLVEVTPDRLVETLAATDYPATATPLLWAFLARHEVTEATLVLVAHHTAADPWSMRILIADLMRAYAARLAGEPAPWPAGSDADPAVWRTGRPPAAQLTDYWREILADLPELVPPAPIPGGVPRTEEFRFPLNATEPELRSTARSHRTTPFVLLLAGFMSALHGISGGGDLMVPVLTYGRARSDWDTVGLFMNALPVRADLAGDPDPTETLARVRAAFATAYPRELPLVDLLARVPEAVRLFAPGGPVCAQFEIIQLPTIGPSSPLSYRPIRLPAGLPLGGPVIPVNAMVVWLEQEPDGSYTGTVRFRADLFGTETVERLLHGYGELVDRMVWR